MNTAKFNRILNHPALPWILGITAVLLYVAPYLILGQDTPVRIHDNMDGSGMQYWRIFHESNPLWHSGESSQRFLNGALPAHNGPNFRFSKLPYYLLPPFAAYTFLQLTTRLVAFVGMLLLLRSLLGKTKDETTNIIVCTGIAILFAILPHYPPSAFTVPALPLLAWCFVAIGKHQDNWHHWLTLCFIPFFTSFFLAPIFLLPFIGLAWAIAAVFERKINWRWLGALALVSVLFCVSEYQLALDAFADNGFISHRTEQKLIPTFFFIGSLKWAYANFLYGRYHVATHHYKLIPLFFLTGLLGVWQWLLWLGKHCNALPHFISTLGGTEKEERQNTIRLNTYFAIAISAFILAGIISLWHGFYRWNFFVSLRQHAPVLDMVNWERLHWLHPLVWYLGLAALLLAWAKILKPRFALPFVLIILVAQGATLMRNADYIQTWRAGEPTWKEFYAEKQFEEIREFIGKPIQDYRVASLGVYPSIPLYNGFYCLDGYATNYSLDYKHEFRNIIAPELSRDEDLTRYFDEWGSRCYLNSTELGRKYMWTKNMKKHISGIDLNLDAFKVMGGEYIISAVHIDNPEASGLRLLKTFDHPESAWQIKLYEPVLR
jgi:hypothetical protein